MRRSSYVNILAVALAALFACDRLLKLAAVAHFFRRPPPAAPTPWPTVTLIQPVTRSTHDLRRTLATRCTLDYPALTQSLLICDAADLESQAVCRVLIDAHPAWQATLIVVAPDSGVIASKIAKITAALPHATGAVLCFVDDDVALRPDALRVLIPYLFEHGVGAAFGLACYTDWTNVWSSSMSSFVNANALLSYIPLAYLTEPFTITGHCFALQRAVFNTAGGLSGMVQRIDDDHELARRVRQLGLRNRQTPLVYDVENRIDTLRGYHIQMKRWFVLPRQTMAPFMTQREQWLSLLGSVGNLLPTLLAIGALLRPRPATLAAFGASMALFGAVYTLCERVYLRRATPLRRWPLLILTSILTPLHVLVALFSGATIEWRGQRLRVRRGGSFEVL